MVHFSKCEKPLFSLYHCVHIIINLIRGCGDTLGSHVGVWKRLRTPTAGSLQVQGVKHRRETKAEIPIERQLPSKFPAYNP